MPAMYAWAHAHTHNHTLEKQPRLPMQRPPSMARTQEVKHSTPRHQLGFSFFAGGGAQGGVSLMPGPPPLHTQNPSLGRGRGPVPTLLAEFRGGGPALRGLAQSRNNRTWRGGRAPQVCVLILFSFPPLQEQSLGREGEGSASWESKDGGKSRPCFASPSHLPKASRSEIVLHPHFPAASFSLHAGAGFGGVCNLQTGAAALLQTEEGRSLASRRGVCDARVAGRARPGWAPTPWPLPPGHPRLLT